jgi:hypothetical protein
MMVAPMGLRHPRRSSEFDKIRPAKQVLQNLSRKLGTGFGKTEALRRALLDDMSTTRGGFCPRSMTLGVYCVVGLPPVAELGIVRSEGARIALHQLHAGSSS